MKGDEPRDDADTLIARLQLQPHPEGGHYRETFRDAGNASGRAHATAIYFLLKAGEHSRWHRIDAAEIWHWYAGAPLALQIAQDGRVEDFVLGNDFARGEQPQIVVPARAWQAARSLGAYTLVGCTVAPGFLFEHFELAPDGFTPER
jgi:predicted cupin superfamily sugar epimerase